MSKKKKEKTTKRSAPSNIVKGTLDISRSGMGFVAVEGFDKDIMVKPHDFGKAFDGDTVSVKINPGLQNGRRIEGNIISVEGRKQTEFLGQLQLNGKIAFVVINGDKPMPDFFIAPDKLNGAVHGDRVLVNFLRWDPQDRKPLGEVVQVITARNEADMAMKEILLQHDFSLQFDEDVLKETAALNGTISETELAKRKDFRQALPFPFAPADAKDFDDALSIQYLENNTYEIGVHIADVSHFVHPDSALDKTAYQRATSVYLPDRVNPMLPEKISNELCSLRPHEDKYTFSAVFIINQKAEVKRVWIGRTVIHSDQRFSYEEVQESIENKTGKYGKEILLLNDLAQKFRKKRFANGAINFSSQEVKFQLDEEGNPMGIVIKESKEAHQLIEEFMLLANRNVAEYVSKIKVNKKPILFPYRIHDTPDEEKLKPFVAFAKKFGYQFDLTDEYTIAASFNELINNVKGKPEQHVLELLAIRTMAKAYYTTENAGHYGLGFDHYCHFTSPIRRYPDVMVHRILQQCLDKNLPVNKQVEEKCKHCSERERAAMECERAGNKYKQVQFMQKFVGEEFDAVISGASTFGFWAETVLHKCEGLVSTRDLNLYDDFRLDETDYALVGERTKKKFRIGDKVKIKVAAANLSRRQLDYDWIPDRPLRTAKSKEKLKPGKKKKKK